MTRLVRLIAICLFLSISVCAQEETTTGSISGRVINESGQGLPGATLLVRAVNSTGPARNTLTDAEGNFRVNGLDPALYTVNANAPGYVLDPTTISLNPTYYRLGDSVMFRLIRGGVITGTVTNSSGEPVVGVRVRIARIRDSRGQLAKLPSYAFFDQPTDDRGVYRIYGIAPGGYVISAGGGSGLSAMFNPYDSDIPTYSPSATRDNAAEVTVGPGDEVTADIRYRGEQGHSISGSVKGGTGNATVTLAGGNISMPLASAFQSFSRGFVFNGLPDGEYKLVAQENAMGLAGGPALLAISDIKRVTVKGASVTGVELLTKPLGSLNGRIVLEGVKVPACEGKRPPLFAETAVSIQRHEKDVEEDDPVYQRFVGNLATPDAKGEFASRNLRPGRYRLEPRFYSRYWYLQSITASTAGAKPQKVDLVANPAVVKPGEQLRNITITLTEGAAAVRGRVTPPEGTAVPANKIYLVPFEAAKAEDALRYFVADIASDNTFTLNSVPPGKYLIVAQVNSDAQTATLAKLRQPEAAAARTKLRRTAESQKTEIELKPCQNLADYQLKQ